MERQVNWRRAREGRKIKEWAAGRCLLTLHEAWFIRE